MVFARTPPCAIEGDSDGVEVVLEKVSVDVESHRSRCVPEHPLDDFGVGACGDCEACGGVSEVVEGEPCCDRGIVLSCPVAGAGEPAVSVGWGGKEVDTVAEDEVPGALSVAVLTECRRPGIPAVERCETCRSSGRLR